MSAVKVKTSRVAVATLELVLSLPVCLALVVGLVWLGYSVIGQAEVTVEARHKAWHKRFGQWSGTPFDFVADELTRGEASSTVEVTPILRDASGPSSRHSIETGPWDYRNVAFKSLPNWQLAADMMLASKTVGLIAEFEDIRDAMQRLRAESSAALTEALHEAATELLGPVAPLEGESAMAKQRVELDQQLERSKTQGVIRDLRQEVKALRRELDEIAGSDDALADDRKWIREQKIGRIEIQIDLARERLARL